MAHCPFEGSCAIFKDEMFSQMHGLIHRFQQTYCQGEFSGCARYKVASVVGESFVPGPMMPTQIEWAEQVLRDHRPSSPAAQTEE